jgi:hypothetical protein
MAANSAHPVLAGNAGHPNSWTLARGAGSVFSSYYWFEFGSRAAWNGSAAGVRPLTPPSAAGLGQLTERQEGYPSDGCGELRVQLTEWRAGRTLLRNSGVGC